MKRVIIGVFLLCAWVGLSPAQDSCPRTVVRIQLPKGVEPGVVTSWSEPWEFDEKGRTLLVDLDREGLEKLRSLGLTWTIDAEKTSRYCAPQFRLPGQKSGIPGYPCYRTVEETLQTADELAAEYPDLAEVIDIGDSWEKATPGGNAGYDMRVLKLTNSNTTGTPTGPGQGKPVLFVTSAIHAREYTTAELMTRFAEYLVENYGQDADATWLLDEHEIHLLLQTNPDGRKQAETGKLWRKNTDGDYCSPTSDSRGADLNRNFSFKWACCGGSSSLECEDTYHGASAASEPETQSVETYAATIFPDQKDDDPNVAAPDTATGLYFDIHSYSQYVLWPWGWDVDIDPPNGTAMQTLGRKLAYFNGYSPIHHIWYDVDGDTIDSIYGRLGVASFVFELGTDFFQDCATFENTIFPDNLQALIYAAKVARTPYLTPSGPEIIDLVVSGGSFIAPGDPAEILARAADDRFNNSNGTEAVGTVAAARCSIDVPPWRNPAPAFSALTADDGAFDEVEEALGGSMATAGLSDGRHTIFCQARDDLGQWGAVSAVFFYIMDPSNAPRIAGRVLSAVDSSPVEATVSAGSVTSVTNDPSTGAYEMILPEGRYTLTAAPTGDGFGPATVEDVTASVGATSTVNFRLTPYQVLVSDDCENGQGEWTAEAPWTLSDEDSSSATHSWTDSVGGEYGNNVNASLISALMDFSGLQLMELRFSHHYVTEATYDFCHVEVSSDGGSTWTEVEVYDGDSGGWKDTMIDLSALDGVERARIRFRITSDGSLTKDGWHIDDIVVRGFADASAGIFQDDFESGGFSAWSSTFTR